MSFIQTFTYLETYPIEKSIITHGFIVTNDKRYTITISSYYRTVPNAIWEIFSEFLIFCKLFHEPLGERNNSKI